MTIHTPRPATFPLTYRVPCWAVNASAKLNGGECSCELESGTWKTVEREWNDGDTLELMFPAKFEIERRWNDSVAIKRGPLVYSLKIGERWEVIREHPVCPDYAVYPTTAWNYGLILDLENPDSSIEIKRNKVSDSNWAPDKAPIELKVKGRKIPEWQLENNCAGELPQSPVKSNEPIEELTLIPYGCAKLRITEFPLLEY